MEQIASLHELFVAKLQKVYDAEQQIIAALPKMIEAATNPELKQAFETHLEETKMQAERLQRAGEALGEEITGMPCAAMTAIIAEGEETLGMISDPDTRDAALIASAQEVEHHEIAAYGTLLAHAQAMEHEEVVPLLEDTLSEEEETDGLLSELAEQQANPEAA